MSQKGGVGGGPAIWDKFPKNVVFFLDKPPYLSKSRGSMKKNEKTGKVKLSKLF